MNSKINSFFTFVYSLILSGLIVSQFITSRILLLFICALVSIAATFFLYNKIKKIVFYKYFLISTFILLITIPLAGPKEVTSLEKRELSPFPVFRISNVWRFLKDYKKYYEDRFAFRNEMLKFMARFKLAVLNISSVPDRVEVGTDRWLYSSGDYYLKLTSLPLTENELHLIETNLQIIDHWLSLKDIDFFFTCVPVKSRIYPDKMPPALKRLNQFSRLDQLYKYLEKNNKVDVIDVRKEVYEGRKIRETYLKTDTHWNEFGAFLAYEKIMREMQKKIPELKYHKLNEYKIDSFYADGGDLLNVMGINTGFPHLYYRFSLISGVEPVKADSAYLGDFMNHCSIREIKGSINRKKIFVNRDSMTEFLKIFLSTSFDRVFYYWKPELNLSLALNEKPDILLYEMQEIFISYLLKLPPEIKADTVFMNNYYPAYDSIAQAVDLDKTILF